MVLPRLSPALAAGLTLLLVFLYGAIHSLTATERAKSWAEGLLGPGVFRLYRLGYNVLGGLTFLPALAISAIEPGLLLYAIPTPWAWLMRALQAAGAAIVGIGLLQTDVWHFLGVRQLTETEPGPSHLVTHGLYRYVRHPLYSGGLLFLWASPVMTTTWLALVVGVSLYLLAGSYFEERRLLAEFGATYAEYRRRVPRLVPRWRR